MNRLSPGTGSVYPMKSRPGTWCGSTSIAGKKHRVYAPTKREARRKLNRLLANGPAPKPATLTVTRLFDEWLTRDVAGRNCAPSTVARHQWAAALWIREVGVRRVSDLSTREVEDALETMAGRLSKASLRQVLSSLKQALAYAQRRDEVDRNVAQVAILPIAAADPDVRRSLTEDEASKLAGVLCEERNGAMYLLMLRRGLRPGEAAALYSEDIDLEAQTLNITRGRQGQDGRFVIVDELKTAAAKRTVAVHADVVSVLRRHRRERNAERMAAPAWSDERLVFASQQGTVLDAANVRRDLARICRVAGVPVLRPNELRHTCASLLKAAGVSHEEIADLLGHTTTRMVDGTYTHRARPVIEVAVNW